MMLLTETLLKPSKSAIVNELTPPGYNFIGECRTVKRGGGTGLLFKSGYKFAKMPSTRFKTFEVLDVKTTHCARPLRVIIIYRSPTSATKSFLDELALYISDQAVVREDILMAGDFNLHIHMPNASGVQYLKQILADNNMHHHVTQPTHRSSNICSTWLSLARPAILSQPRTYARAAYLTTTVSSSLYMSSSHAHQVKCGRCAISNGWTMHPLRQI